MSESQFLVPGRSCEGCTLCCKLMGVPPLGKPQGVMCSHCTVGGGCGIYQTRPEECRGFYCGYRQIAYLGEYWFPASSKMILLWNQDQTGEQMAIHVDPDFPKAWRTEPHYSEIKQLALAGAGIGRSVVVTIGRRAIAILPDEDVDLGILAADEVVVTITERRANGTVARIYAEKRTVDDADGPRPRSD